MATTGGADRELRPIEFASGQVSIGDVITVCLGPASNAIGPSVKTGPAAESASAIGWLVDLNDKFSVALGTRLTLHEGSVPSGKNVLIGHDSTFTSGNVTFHLVAIGTDFSFTSLTHGSFDQTYIGRHISLGTGQRTIGLGRDISLFDGCDNTTAIGNTITTTLASEGGIFIGTNLTENGAGGNILMGNSSTMNGSNNVGLGTSLSVGPGSEHTVSLGLLAVIGENFTNPIVIGALSSLGGNVGEAGGDANIVIGNDSHMGDIALGNTSRCTIVGGGSNIIGPLDSSSAFGVNLTVHSNFCLVTGSGSSIDTGSDNSVVIGSTSSIGIGSFSCVVMGQSNTIGASATRSIVIGGDCHVGDGEGDCTVIGDSCHIGVSSTDVIMMADGGFVGNNAPNTIAIGNSASVGNSSASCVVLGNGSVIATNSPTSVCIGDSCFIGDNMSASVVIGSSASTQASQVISIGESALVATDSSGSTAINGTIVATGKTGCVSINGLIGDVVNTVREPFTSLFAGANVAIAGAVWSATSSACTAVNGFVSDNCAASIAINGSVGSANSGAVCLVGALGDNCNGSVCLSGSVDNNAFLSFAALGKATVHQEVIFGTPRSVVGDVLGVSLFHAVSSLFPALDLLKFDTSAIVANHDSAMYLLYKNALGTIVLNKVTVNAVTGALTVPV